MPNKKKLMWANFLIKQACKEVILASFKIQVLVEKCVLLFMMKTYLCSSLK